MSKAPTVKKVLLTGSRPMPLRRGLQKPPVAVHPRHFVAVRIDNSACVPRVVRVPGAIRHVAESSGVRPALLHECQLAACVPGHRAAVAGTVRIVVDAGEPLQFCGEHPQAQRLRRRQHGGLRPKDVNSPVRTFTAVAPTTRAPCSPPSVSRLVAIVLSKIFTPSRSQFPMQRRLELPSEYPQRCAGPCSRMRT